jgi:hypothetical protein
MAAINKGTFLIGAPVSFQGRSMCQSGNPRFGTMRIMKEGVCHNDNWNRKMV